MLPRPESHPRGEEAGEHRGGVKIVGADARRLILIGGILSLVTSTPTKFKIFPRQPESSGNAAAVIPRPRC